MSIDESRGYRIHMNLNKKCFSISRYFIEKKGWRVTNYVKNLEATNIVLKVSEKSRQRAVNNKSRNVHAYAFADNIKMLPKNHRKVNQSCNYNPFKNTYFYNLETGEEISKLDYAYFNNNKINYNG